MNTLSGEFPGQVALVIGGGRLASGRFLASGDEVVAEIEGTGTLRNAVIRR